jgi:hypothetical protein
LGSLAQIIKVKMDYHLKILVLKLPNLEIS